MSDDTTGDGRPLRTTDEVLDGVDLTGRVAVVTGATTGLGFETARALALAGAHVVLTARSAEKGDDALARLRERVRDASAEAGVLELGSLASVRTFTDECNERLDALHLLVANAGIMMPPLGRTAEGFELQFGTNHLGHFALTARLMPLLLAGAPARVVVLSSGGHHASGVDLDDPNYERREYGKMEAYGQSKTANVLFAAELDRRYGARGVHAFSVHPGMVRTDLGRNFTRDDFAEMAGRAKSAGTSLPPLYEVEVGASTSVWAATAPELVDEGGAYLADCSVAQAAAHATGSEVAAALWRLSEELVGETFPAP